MKIAVPSLAPGRHVFESAFRPSELGESARETGLTFCGDVGVRATVDKMGEELFVQGEVTAAIRAKCARCLEPLDAPVAASFEALYAPAGQEDGRGHAERVAEWEKRQTVYYPGGMVDLSEQIVEAIELAVPMKPLCREDCKGLCPRCGKNLNDGACGCARADDFNRPFKGLFEEC